LPESAEVRSSADILNSWVSGDQLSDIDSADINGKFLKKDIKGIKSSNLYFGETLKEVHTKGKFMYFEFTNQKYLGCGLGMAAQWSQEKNKHTCFSLTFKNKGKIYFNDMRHFGNIEFMSKKDLDEKLNELGIDLLPLDPAEISGVVDEICEKLLISKQLIADDLLNQNIFAGVGNYLRAEALYDSGIDPMRFSFSLSESEVLKLSLSLNKIMNDAYRNKGASILTYKNADNSLGTFTFKCYGRDTDDRGNKILTRKTKNDRTLYYCPEAIKTL